MEKSNKFLKVTGILMIISGSIALLASFFLLIFGVLLGMGAIHHPSSEVIKTAGLVETGVVLAIVGSIVQFIAGVSGVKNAKNPEKATNLIVLGALTVLFYLGNQLFNFIGGGNHTYLDYVSILLGMVVPAFYILGAVQLKAKDD